MEGDMSILDIPINFRWEPPRVLTCEEADLLYTITQSTIKNSLSAGNTCGILRYKSPILSCEGFWKISPRKIQ